MKYVGSKQRIAKYIVPEIQKEIENTGATIYIEPFVGGANVIDKIQARHRFGSDQSSELIALLKAARDGIEFPETVTKEEYDEARVHPEKFPKWFVGLAGFCASYNAKYFGGYANGVKTKIGTIRNYTDEAIRNIEKQRERLKGCTFMCCDYTDWSGTTGAVIYCDPPYKGTTDYMTGTFDSDSFFEWCRQMAKENIVYVSEYSAPDDFEIVAEIGLATSLDKKQKIGRTERLFRAKGGRT